MGLIFLFLTNLSGATKAVCMKKCGKLLPGKENSVRINFFRTLICIFVSLIIFLVSGSKVSWEKSYIWILSGISNAGLLFFWLLCSERASLLQVETFGLIGSMVFPLFFAPLLYEGESVGIMQWCGMSCLLIAVVVLSRGKENNKETSDHGKKAGVDTVFFLIFLVLSNAGVSITQKLFATRIGVEFLPHFNLMTFSVVLICYGSIMIFEKIHTKRVVSSENDENVKPWIRPMIYIAIAALAIYAYQYFGAIASGELSSALYYPLVSGISISLTTLSDIFIFKQKFTRYTLISLIFVIAAIVMINIVLGE